MKVLLLNLYGNSNLSSSCSISFGLISIPRSLLISSSLNVTTLGVRDNKYCTALGMIKYFIDKMESRGREYSMVSVEDETSLVTPNNKLKKDNAIINKIFGGFIAGKEDK